MLYNITLQGDPPSIDLTQKNPQKPKLTHGNPKWQISTLHNSPRAAT